MMSGMLKTKFWTMTFNVWLCVCVGGGGGEGGGVIVVFFFPMKSEDGL